jgi:hypothetical protein
MRNVVDGDTWFYVKPIADNGQILGISKHSGALINIIAITRRSGGVKYTINSAINFTLIYKQAELLVKYLRECHEKSKTISKNDWGGLGTYIKRTIELEYGTVVDVVSYGDGEVWLSVLNTDKRGIHFMNSANELTFTLTKEGLRDVLSALGTELGKITDQAKLRALEYELKKEKERAAISKPPIIDSNGKCYIDKFISVEDLTKRINSYLIKHSADPANVVLDLEYQENWEEDGPRIILRPK